MKEADPNWPRIAVAALAREVVEYLRTVAEVARAPSRFAAAWASGEREALNPLACLLNALAVLGPWHVLWAGLLDIDEHTPMWIQLAKPALPVLGACFLAGGAHLVLWLGGTRRPLRTTLGVTLFVQSGPVTVLSLAFRPLSDLMMLGRATVIASLASFAVVIVFCVYLVAGLSGALHTTRRRAAFAVISIFVTWMAFWMVLNKLAPHLVRGLII